MIHPSSSPLPPNDTAHSGIINRHSDAPFSRNRAPTPPSDNRETREAVRSLFGIVPAPLHHPRLPPCFLLTTTASIVWHRGPLYPYLCSVPHLTAFRPWKGALHFLVRAPPPHVWDIPQE
ncbi:unnamed protein product [Tuber aestivum]|uniref:Uncharacterized protein n=1 Tax=Tuber aestivum TaxID=59557 RepID=A0A292Q2J7_9PEZI|nr:unnamed protein product [Tuber aestivum]